MTEQLLEQGPSSTAWPLISTKPGTVIGCFGRKGQGKSQAANMIYRNWPDSADRICVDVSGDDRPSARSTRISGEPPRKMPDRDKAEQPVDLWYVANPASHTYRDDLDRVLRVGLYPRERPKLVLIHEVGEVLPAGQTPPHGRLLLQQGRHFKASTILCGPRPMRIEPLALQQCDEMLLFDLPNPADRRRVAETIGWEPRELDEAFRELKAAGDHWFLRYSAGPHELVLCPPLPPEWLEDAA